MSLLSPRRAQSQWTSTADAELHTSGNSEPTRSRISFAEISHNDSSNKFERSASNMGATPTVQVILEALCRPAALNASIAHTSLCV
eukprot:3937688-Amphidinium_carterae.1